MPEKCTRLGFTGFCKTDIILYMARILTCLGERVAIVDLSGEQDLRMSVPAGIYLEDRLDYRGVEVFLNCSDNSFTDMTEKNHSVVLLDYGVNRKAIESVSELRTLFIVTDLQRHHAVPLASFLEHLQSPTDSIRIIRDIVPGKIRPRYIDSLLQAAQHTNLLAKYELSFDEAEYSQRLLCQYDDIFHFTKITESYKSMLLEVVVELLGFERRAAVKAFKKAQHGG
ncbi:MAG: hypothetical protein KBA53_11880 [Thermoclostridium sp.]|nr:hypothetical protein [Thermoclostridium sp.]